MNRIRLQPGQRLPNGTVNCTRGPLALCLLPAGRLTRMVSLRYFHLWAEAAFQYARESSPLQKRFVAAVKAIEAKGDRVKSLGCTCALGDKCHVDSILEILEKRKATATNVTV